MKTRLVVCSLPLILLLLWQAKLRGTYRLIDNETRERDKMKHGGMKFFLLHLIIGKIRENAAWIIFINETFVKSHNIRILGLN